MDLLLFRLVNQASANPLYDAIFPFLTRGRVVMSVIVGGLLLVLGWALARREPEHIRRALLAMLVVGVAVALSELLGSQLLKPLVGRPRPPLHYGLEQVRLLVPLGPSLSFPSAHAANTAAFAVGLSRAFPALTRPSFAFAAAIAYSRVYVGVHHVSDVLAGALLGGVLAAGLWCLAGASMGSRAVTGRRTPDPPVGNGS